jgi:eukaryotic-like serine/threonine-protein kinase
VGFPPQPPIPPPSGSGPGSYGAPQSYGWGGNTPLRTYAEVQSVGRYELLLELASGGMGSVYVGRQRGAAGFERLVAIKRMHPHLSQSHEFTLAFHEEARIASLIHHPNVVNVVDVYEEGGEHLIVMDLIDGTSAGTLMTEARNRGLKLPRPVALRLAIDTLAGLHAAHELHGMDGTPLMVVHRDVSPQNILVGVDGAVRITDFGIARALQRMVHTATGELKGKLRYMPPEQARGHHLDRRADVFSMGIVLWEMLSGDRAYKGESDLELLRAAGDAEITPLSRVDPTTPAPLEAIVMQALAKHPDHRFPSAAAFAAALERWAWEARELASAADVANVVRQLAGERITARRRQLQDVLAGRRPAAVRSGTHALVQGTPITSHAAILGPASQAQPRKSSALVGVFLAVLAAGGGVGLGAVAYLRLQKPAPTAVAAANATDATTPASSASAAANVPHVNIRVFASAPISVVRGDGVANVTFSADGASFHLPKGDKPVDVEVHFEGGNVEKRTVTPTDDTAVRIGAAAAEASASAAPAVGGAKPAAPPGGQRPRAAQPPAEAGESKGDGLRKNPYQQ